MLEAFIIRQPYEIAWSENPMVYTFAISPYTTAEKNRNLILRVQIYVEQRWNSNDFNLVNEQAFYPNGEGLVHFDISTIVDPYLAYFIPPLTATQAIECTNQTKRYRLDYTLTDENTIIATTAQSDVQTAIKGGMALEFQNPVGYLRDTMLYLTNALANGGTSSEFRDGEQRYLYFLCRADADYTGLTREIAAYTKANALLFTHEYTIGVVKKYRVYCLPVSPAIVLPMLNVADMAYLHVNLQTLGLPLVRLTNDTRKFYDTHQLIYRNSFGGLDTITLRGQAEYSADYDRQVVDRVNFPDSYLQGFLRPQKEQKIITEQYSTKADTGFITKEKLDSLRDMFLSEEIYEYKRTPAPPGGLQPIDGRLLPALINNNKIKFFTNRDKLFSVEIDYQVAWVNTKYSSAAEGIDNSCPAPMSLRVKQVSKSQLEIMWSLLPPYDLVEIEINNGGSPITLLTFRLSGNTGRQVIRFTNPAVDENVDITIRARTVCDPWTDPNSLSSWISFVLSVYKNSPPVAIDNTYNIAAGYTSPVTLTPPALDNDYDPDGDAIAIVADSGTTAAGGTYTIDAAGVITYQPPDIYYNGPDYFDYTLTETATTPQLTDTGRIYINVGDISARNVYVKLVERNVTRQSNGYDEEIRGERWVYFYSDPAGTIPLNVAGRTPAIVVNIQEHYYSTFSDTPTDTNVYYPQAGSGYANLFYSGLFTLTIHDTNTDTDKYEYYQHFLLSGTGYIVI